MPPRCHCRLLESYFGPLGGHFRPQGVHFWPIKSHLGLQVGQLGPPGKSVWTSEISHRVKGRLLEITERSIGISGGVLWSAKRSFGTFWTLKEITWGSVEVTSSFIVVIWGSWGATWGPREVPRELLHYPSWPQEGELNIKQETSGGDILLIRAEIRAFSCVIFILTPFLNGLS